MVAPHNILMLAFFRIPGCWTRLAPSRCLPPPTSRVNLPDFARRFRTKGGTEIAALQDSALVIFPVFGHCSYFTGPLQVLLAPSSIDDSHCREIGGARAKRLRASASYRCTPLRTVRPLDLICVPGGNLGVGRRVSAIAKP